MFVRVMTQALVVLAAIAGTAHAFELHAYVPRMTVGSIALREVVARVRDRGDALEACVAADAFGSRLVACSALPRSLDLLQDLHDVAVTWRLAGAGATGHGTARLSWTGSANAFAITGVARAAALDLGGVGLRDAELPLDLRVSRDGMRLAAHKPLVIGWRAIAGLPVDLGPGSAMLSLLHDGVRVEHARLAAQGAALAVDPFDIRNGLPVAATLHVRGLALARVLEVATRGRIQGSGMLDADLQLRRDGGRLAISNGTVRARGPGNLRVRDFAWTDQIARSSMGMELHQRIASTLEDFAYDQLSLVVRPRETPSTLVLHGHGEHIPQQLDITVNVRR